MYKQNKTTKSRLSLAMSAMLVVLTISTHTTIQANEPQRKPKTVNIRGTVVDEKSNPLVGVSIWNQSSYRGATTNAEGKFSLYLPSGDIELRVSYIGYQTANVNFFATGDTTLRLSLNPSAILCDEVIISDSRVGTSTPLTYTSLNRKDIQDNNISGALPYVIEMEPSMVSTAENGTQVGNTSFRLRGTDATRINVNINGIPLNNAESQGVYWVNIVNLAAMSESVQIQRGAGSSNGGTSAFGGAISLQTLNPATEAYATADISRGSFNTNQTSLMVGTGLLKDGLAFDASYSKLSSDGFLRNGFCDHESFYFSAGKYGERSLFKFVTIIGKQHTGITWNGATREEIAADPTYNNAGAYTDEMGNTRYYDNETDNYWQQHFQLYYSYQLSDQWLFNTALNYTHGYGYYENYKADKKFTDYGFDNQMLITNGDTSIIKRSDFVIRKLMNNSSYTENASLQYKTDRLTFNIGEMVNYYDGDHYGNVLWCKQPSLSINEDYEWYRNIGTKTDVSAFAKAEYMFSSKLSGYADMQYRFVLYNMDGIDDDFLTLDYSRTYNFFNPKVGLSYSPDKVNRFSLLASIANREPTRADIKDAIKGSTADDPEPETMLDIELGYSYNPTRWKLSANAYFMGYKNQLVSSGKLNSVGYVLMENVDRSYRIGIELTAGAEILSWLKIDANIALSQNKIIDYIHYEEHYDNPNDWNTTPQVAKNYGNTQLAFSPNIVGAAIATIEPTKNFKLQLIGKYVGEQYYDNTQREETRLDPYFVINSKVSYLWKLRGGKEIEFQLLVNNILDKQYINNAWGYEAHFDDGSPKYVEQGFFVQPGINGMGRIVLKL